MKPVIIIAIAVVCSIVAVFGVLAVLQGIATIQAQQAYDEYEKELTIQQALEEQSMELASSVNRAVCVELLGNRISMPDEINPYAYCLEYGAMSAIEKEKNVCFRYPSEIYKEQCELNMEVDYYNSLIPKLEKLSEQERMLISYDPEVMKEIRTDWTLKSNLLDLTYEVIRIQDEERKEGWEWIEVTIPTSEGSSELSKPSTLTPDGIKIQYLDCKKDEKYGSSCKDTLKEMMDEYCRMTTSSHTEYDACFGEITKIQ